METNHRPPSRRREDATDRPLSLTDLTEAADVTVRTVRYYIAEGLLPPPVTAGRQSHYTRGHLDRLRLIARLKDAYLPLKEIRRQLAGLDDAAVRALLVDGSDSASSPPTSARSYLDRVLGAPLDLSTPPPDRRLVRSGQQPPPGRTAVDETAARYDSAPAAPERSSPLPVGVATPLMPSVIPPEPEADPTPEAWRRVRLADDAELLIRESAYQQRMDRIDWLIRWARRVFG